MTMVHTLVLEVPEELYEPLVKKAKQTGQAPEKVVLEWLKKTIQPLHEDPLLQLAGIFESDLTDIGEKHDEYIGQGLMRELRGGK